MVRNICCIIILALCLSCHNGNKKELINIHKSDTIAYREPLDSTISTYVSDVDYLPLLGSDIHFLKEITKVRFIDSLIILGDKNQGKICVYNQRGEFMYEIARRGKAEQEYLEISNFTIDKNYIYVLDNVKNKLNKYNIRNGKYSGSLKMDFMAWDIEKLGENEFIFTLMPNNAYGEIASMPKQPNYYVWTTDENLKIKNTFLSVEEGYYEMIGKPTYFSVMQNGVAFHMYKYDGIFMFYPNEKKYDYLYLFFSNGIPDDLRKDYHAVEEAEYNYISLTPFINSNYAAVNICTKGYDEQMIIDRKEKRIVGNQEIDSKNMLFFVSGCYDDKFISVMSYIDIYKDMVNSGFKKADKTTEDLLNNGGSCLIFYTMK